MRLGSGLLDLLNSPWASILCPSPSWLMGRRDTGFGSRVWLGSEVKLQEENREPNPTMKPNVQGYDRRHSQTLKDSVRSAKVCQQIQDMSEVNQLEKHLVFLHPSSWAKDLPACVSSLAFHPLHILRLGSFRHDRVTELRNKRQLWVSLWGCCLVHTKPQETTLPSICVKTW